MENIELTNLCIEGRNCLKIHTSIILLRNSLFGYVSKERNVLSSIMYFIRGLTRKLHLASKFFDKMYEHVEQRAFDNKWLRSKESHAYYDFFGAKIPKKQAFPLGGVFHDTFYFYCLFHDYYDKDLVLQLDSYLNEGAYGFMGDGLNVKVDAGDVVIDAGAWIGDFSAYAAAKGATVYAFEPTSATYDVLCETAELNSGHIYPIRKGLSNKNGESYISINESNSGGNSIAFSRSEHVEKIETTTIDRFVLENKIPKIDFIKADIEGFERYMLLGATETLKKYAPKLAICTYHCPDDPHVLEKIILDANPKYKIVHLKKKLLAQVL